jgi:hypothetical protein
LWMRALAFPDVRRSAVHQAPSLCRYGSARMNAGAAIQVGAYLLRKGGIQAAEDTASLLSMYHAFSSGVKLPALLTDGNISVIRRSLVLLAQGLQDASEEPELMLLLKSLAA